jgi:ATP phosphoribosyltransferase
LNLLSTANCLSHLAVCGTKGPTISPVFTPANGGGAAAEHGFYAAVICVPKKKLYTSVKALRKV